MHAVTCLPAVTGAWQHKGGGALYVHYDIYGIDKTLIEGLDRRDESVRRLDQSRIGAILCGHADVLQGGPPVTAMLIQNTNPVVVAPESGLVRRGFERDDLFVCVHEQVMTETAAMADIVLPATTFLEHDDMYLSGGHTFMQISPRVINPLADCRPNHDVICGLAKRLGARHEGFTLSTWEIIDRTLKSSGYEGADALAKKRWHDCAVDFEEAHFLSGFAHPDGRFRFRPDWASIGPDADRLPAFPDHAELIEAADAEHPFRMVTAPARFFLNTTFTETENSVRKEKRPTAMLAPGDCESLGIGAGDQVILGNARGEVHLHAEVTEAVKPGTVIVESVWPNAAFINGCGINTLVGSSPGLPDGGGAYHDTAVWIRAARAVR